MQARQSLKLDVCEMSKDRPGSTKRQHLRPPMPVVARKATDSLANPRGGEKLAMEPQWEGALRQPFLRHIRKVSVASTAFMSEGHYLFFPSFGGQKSKPFGVSNQNNLPGYTAIRKQAARPTRHSFMAFPRPCRRARAPHPNNS